MGEGSRNGVQREALFMMDEEKRWWLEEMPLNRL